jgi:hypothetical protein
MSPTRGPLTRCATNPRYFADGSGRPLLLAGLHTWNNLMDMGPSDPPPPLDFARYLDLLAGLGHNFTRMWAWDMLCTWSEQDRLAPFPWRRSGPGVAVDGRPRFDLTQFDEAYFARLLERVTRAGRQGIYVDVMLFDGWGARTASCARRDLHLFAGGNNVNGIDILSSEADGVLRAWCTLDYPEVLRLQEAYVRKVVETLNGCDNVLYEIANEAGGASHAWQEHLIALIRSVEAGLPMRHLVGHTGGGGTLNRLSYATGADYLSPDVNAADGTGNGYKAGALTWGAAPFDRADKVVVLDTDHLWGIGGDTAWVWKSFCRGYNLLYMDPCTDQPWWFFSDPAWANMTSSPHVRYALGKIRQYAERLDLATTIPANELSTTTYCLATPGKEYLVYQPDPGPFSLHLAAGTYAAEWHWPARPTGQTGLLVQHDGGWRAFQASAESVLLLTVRGA